MSKQKPGPKPYTFDNQQNFPILTKLTQFQQAKELAINESNWQKYLQKSGPLFVKWFSWYSPEYVLVEIDQKERKIKFYQSHPKIHNKNSIAQHKCKGQLIFSELRSFDQKLIIDLKNNFITGAITPSFKYNWLKYGEQGNTNLVQKVSQLGVKFDIGKWLSKTTIANEKKIFFSIQDKFKSEFLPFERFSASIFLANRSNFYRFKNQKVVNTQKIVKKSSDIFGYSITGRSQKLGFQLGLEGGYDYFHNYNFNKLSLMFGNFSEFENHVIEMSVRGGMVFGRDLMENDLLQRNKRRWNDDRSNAFLSTRFNLIFKKFHPILGGVFQTVPILYLEGCASRNSKQIKTKYELDYGIGLRFLNIGVTFDTSLLRIGKNLDDINPSIRIIF